MRLGNVKQRSAPIKWTHFFTEITNINLFDEFELLFIKMNSKEQISRKHMIFRCYFPE